LKQGILQKDLDKALANSQYKKYFGYDKETDSILLNEAEFNKLSNDKKDAVMEEYERIKMKMEEFLGRDFRKDVFKIDGVLKYEVGPISF
jgi:hypothetical protein